MSRHGGDSQAELAPSRSFADIGIETEKQMPIYEYRCESCQHRFETLVLGEDKPECPSCQSQDLERLLSLPRVHSSTTKAMSMRAAKKRDKAQATERVITQHEYEQSHND